MKTYKLLYKQSVEKDLRKINKQDRALVVKKIQQLADNPRPNGVTRLRGLPNLYRVRQSDYRIIYKIKDDQLIITIIKIGHRKAVYKNI